MMQQGVRRGCLSMNSASTSFMSYQIEICANSVQSAINAELGGANRVELCDNLWEGGTTPSHASIKLAKEQVDIPVFVLVRPRGGDFVYSDLEFEIIKADIKAAKTEGADGIVSGVLLPDGTIDVERTSELVRLTSPLPFTFHRAFDHVPNMESGVEDLVRCGVSRVLTSGQKENATEGVENLKRLIDLAESRLVILPGGGVNEGNINHLYEIGCREFHFSAKTQMKGASYLQGVVPMNGSKDIPEDKIIVSDPKKIRTIKKILDEKL